MFGGFVVIAIREGTRFLGDVLPGTFPVALPDALSLVGTTYATVVSNIASTRLLAVGLIIILVMRFRPEGVLPPQRELIWPRATEESGDGPPSGDERPVSADGGDGGDDR
jgi:branched-chain amino acid transport system permease protein